MRGLVIEEHDRMAAASITTLYQTICDGRHGEVTTQIVQLQHTMATIAHQLVRVES
jgi:hypothetical protein